MNHRGHRFGRSRVIGSSPLTASGVYYPPQAVAGLGDATFTMSPFWTAVSIASSGVSAFHGYKRNDSVGWAIWWAFMGGIFPVITPVIALAQGYGKRAR